MKRSKCWVEPSYGMGAFYTPCNPELVIPVQIDNGDQIKSNRQYQYNIIYINKLIQYHLYALIISSSLTETNLYGPKNAYKKIE